MVGFQRDCGHMTRTLTFGMHLDAIYQHVTCRIKHLRHTQGEGQRFLVDGHRKFAQVEKQKLQLLQQQ